VRALRTTDVKVLDVPMERISGEIKAPGGVSGNGSVFVINHNADNALATLRYKLGAAADVQSAEEPFDADGKHFNRGSFVIRNVSRADLDRLTRDLGVQAHGIAAVPNVKLHPARAARVALLHTWQNTQTEGWWRQALDFLQIPYAYISTQDVGKTPNLNTKYDVILFPPAGGANAQSIIQGMPQWRNPLPWKKTPDTPAMGVIDQTDDMRPGLGWQGVANLESFVRRGGVLVGVENTADFAVQMGLASGVSVNQAKRGEVVGTLLRSRIVDDASPIVYGVKDSLALYSADGESFSVSNTRGGRGFGRFGGGSAQRATGRGTADDPDVVQGRTADERFNAPRPAPVQPWQAAPITDDMLRNPVNVIPPDQRPRVAVRFSEQRDLLVSGLLDGGNDIAQRPAVVDAPLEKGHVVLFANNPIYRGETIGSYFLVFNTILNFDNLNAGRKLDAK